MESRSENVRENIIYSFLLKTIGVGLSFLLLPLTIHYLTAIEYGIWVTLFSVMNWVNMLDMGIGLGLRNKLAEAVSRNDLLEMRIYISTGIAAMFGMGTILLVIFFVGIHLVNLQKVYNTVLISEYELYNLTFWTGIFIILSFVFSIINQIYYAYQKAAVTGIMQIVYNLIMLLIVYYLTLQPVHHLLYFSFSFGIAVILSKSIFIINFFRVHQNVRPKYSYIKLQKIKSIVTLGVKFFVIQLACIAMYSAANILIIQELGPEHVRAYDVVFKIFSVIIMINGLICTPLWNAYTDAYIRKDYRWIKKCLHKLQLLMIPISLFSFLLVWKIDWIIELWLKVPINMPPYLALCMGIYVIIACWSGIWVTFLNGIGKVELQMYVAVISAVFILLMSFKFMRILDSTGMILAIDIGALISAVIFFIQVKYLQRKML